MDEELLAFDQAHQKKKKTVVIVGAVLVVLLAALLLLGQIGHLFGPETPAATQVAAVTTEPPASATLTPSPTTTPTPNTATPIMPTATSIHTETPTATPIPTETEPPPTPTVTPSPTPQPPTPTLTLTLTLTPTVPPPTPVAPVIQNPTPGSEVPGDALTVFGTAAPEAVIQLYEGDTFLGETVATTSGSWSTVPSQPLAAGEHTIVAIDATTGQTSAPITFSLLGALLPITGGEGGTSFSPRSP